MITRITPVDTRRPAVEGLLEALAGVPPLPGAACRGLSAVFDCEDPGDWRARRALALCRTCPALARCRDWVDSLAPAQRPPGVAAGRLNRRRL